MPETPKKLPRLYGWLLFTLALLFVAWYLAPHRIPLTGWKVLLVTGGAVLGYWLDRAIFPYLRPGTLWDMYTSNQINAAMPAVLSSIRRAVIVFGCIIGLTMGL